MIERTPKIVDSVTNCQCNVIGNLVNTGNVQGNVFNIGHIVGLGTNFVGLGIAEFPDRNAQIRDVLIGPLNFRPYS